MKIGDYVRTKDGIIGKIEAKNYIGYSDWLIDTLYYNDDEIINGWTCGIKEYNIIKSSPNIIDLIEKSDLVVDNYGNIYMVDYVFDNYIYTTTKQGNIIKTLCNYQIKSIVTKEQFESMEYKVGE